MGHRELKRVPLNFDAPLNKTWEGYFNPYRPPKECDMCGGSGYNVATKRIADDFYGYSSSTGEGWCYNITQDEVEALVEAGRLWDFVRRPINKEQEEELKKQAEAGGSHYWLAKNNGYMPTAKEVNEWNEKGIGHDGINRHYLIKARAKRLGVYGFCADCNGEGWIYKNKRIKKLYEEWESDEPPTGEGYQLWETTSEGSPVSPVFKTAEELAEWCEDNASVFGGMKTTKEKWLKMFLTDSVDSGSLMIKSGNYIGAVINNPSNKEL
jgi:hypothetical protein